MPVIPPLDPFQRIVDFTAPIGGEVLFRLEDFGLNRDRLLNGVEWHGILFSFRSGVRLTARSFETRQSFIRDDDGEIIGTFDSTALPWDQIGIVSVNMDTMRVVRTSQIDVSLRVEEGEFLGLFVSDTIESDDPTLIGKRLQALNRKSDGDFFNMPEEDWLDPEAFADHILDESDRRMRFERWDVYVQKDRDQFNNRVQRELQPNDLVVTPQTWDGSVANRDFDEYYARNLVPRMMVEIEFEGV